MNVKRLRQDNRHTSPITLREALPVNLLSVMNPPMPYAPPTRQELAPDYTKASDNANVDLFSNFLVRRSTMTRHHWTPKMCQHLHVLSTSLTFLNLLTGGVGDINADVNTEFSSLVLDVNGNTDDIVT